MRVPSSESLRENVRDGEKTSLWGEVHLQMEKEPDHYYSYYRLYIYIYIYIHMCMDDG